MAIRPHDVDDFVLLTIDNYDKGKWERVLGDDYPEYASTRIIESKGIKETGGAKLKWPLQSGTVDTARNTTGLYDVDQTATGDIASMAEITWAMQTTNWSYDIDEELFQDDDLTIVDMLKMRESDCLSNMVKLNETNLWSAPSSTADTRPNGIPYWVVKDVTTVEGAFTASLPSGHTTVAGVDPAVATGHRNWAFGYTSATIDDLVRKSKRAMRHTSFTAPKPHPQLSFGGQMQKEIWTTEDVMAALEVECENRNENHGNELMRYVDNVVLKGVPVRISWQLDATDATDPFYGVDWAQIRPFVKRGANMRRKIKESPTQRNVRTVHYDTWMNYRCVSRKRLWVGSKS
jgi:hypothetical protein